MERSFNETMFNKVYIENNNKSKLNHKCGYPFTLPNATVIILLANTC